MTVVPDQSNSGFCLRRSQLQAYKPLFSIIIIIAIIASKVKKLKELTNNLKIL